MIVLLHRRIASDFSQPNNRNQIGKKKKRKQRQPLNELKLEILFCFINSFNRKLNIFEH